jgi:hypothetical protein
MSDTEDSFYNAQTVEDEIMLIALELSGEGLSNDEITVGLCNVIDHFAGGIQQQVDREGVASLLESTVQTLRTEPADDTAARPWLQPEAMANVALCRLQNQAKQEGREEHPRP